jgi:hypothetical protein
MMIVPFVPQCRFSKPIRYAATARMASPVSPPQPA